MSALAAVLAGAVLGGAPAGVAALLADRARIRSVADARAARAGARAARSEAAAAVTAVRAQAAAAVAIAHGDRDAARSALAAEREGAAGRERQWRDELLGVEREWRDCAWEWQRTIETQDRRIDAYHRRRRSGQAVLPTLDVDPVDVPTIGWQLPAGPDHDEPAAAAGVPAGGDD